MVYNKQKINDMLISEIGIKNFRSFGNNEQVLKLNTETGELILISGANGGGKSLIPQTEIEIFLDITKIELDYNTIKNIVGEISSNIIITLEKLNKLQSEINFIDKYKPQVLTQNGYKTIKAIGITSPNSVKIKIQTINFSLSGSPYHRVIKNNDWVFINTLKIGDEILTKNGYEGITYIENDNEKEDLWDIEVEGSEYYSNGIVSHNSSLLNSFDFTIYGKCRGGRDRKWATLASLPNRINGELLNRIKFNSDGVNVEVKRGVAPNFLELIENNIVNKRAGKSNINDIIEKYVGMDLESFKSFISMNISDFKNFMSLSNEEKQLLLDKLFNLEVINILNSILKDLNKNNKVRIASLDAEIRTLEDSIDNIKTSIKKAIEKGKQNIQLEIDEIKSEMNSRKDEYTLLKAKMIEIKEKEVIIDTDLESERKQYSIVQNDIKNTQKEIDLYDMGKCPTCGTDFNSEHFVNLRSLLIEKKNGFLEVKNSIEENGKQVKERQTKLKELKETTTKSFNDLNYLLQNYKSQIEKLNIKKTQESTDTFNIEEFQNSIKEFETKKEISINNKTISIEKELYYKELNRIFGEDGVKKSIITSIIKPINAYLSENIKSMSLPFSVTLDETFTAEIKHLGTIIDQDTLSTGEAKLTNICILIAYLKLIRTKKHINILFLDEVFSSVDVDNIQKILLLLKSFANEYNINIFVVHHAVLNREMFDRVIRIEKNIFSQIIEDVE